MEANKKHNFSALFGKELYLFRTDVLSIIMSLDTVYTAISICPTIEVDCLLTESQHKSSTSCCEYSMKTPDDG